MDDATRTQLLREMEQALEPISTPRESSTRPATPSAGEAAMDSTPAPADAACGDPGVFWDPEQWHYDPVSRRGLAYDLMRPCECENTEFVLITRGTADRDHHCVCRRCWEAGKFRLKTDRDIIYAKFDVNVKRVVYRWSVEETLARRAAIGGPKS